MGHIKEKFLKLTKKNQTEMKLKIDGKVREIDEIINPGYLPIARIGDAEYYLARDREHAGQRSREYWRNMAKYDSEEFACIIGKKRLVGWAFGESDQFGISSLDEFLDAVKNTPEELWGSYDGTEMEVEPPVDFEKLKFDNLDDISDFLANNKNEDVVTSEDHQNLESFGKIVEELGFVPTVAYRHH